MAELAISVKQAIAYQQVQNELASCKRYEQELRELNQSLEAKVAKRTQELWQVNHLQRAILGSTDYAIISTDLNGIIQTFNVGAEKMLGYSMGEVVGQVTPEIFYDPQEFNDKITKASIKLGRDIGGGFGAKISMVMEGLMIEEEWTNIRKDGSRFPAEISLTVLKDESDRPIGILSVSKDISDRKQIEIALKFSEDRFRRVFDSSVIGMIFADFQGNIIEANDRFLAMVGYTREDFQFGAINWMALTPPEYIARDNACLEILRLHSQMEPWEKEYYRKDGSRVSILLGTTLLSGGRDDETVCMIVDISNLKHAEKQVLDITAALDRTTILAFTDPKGTINYVNDKLCEISQYSRDELLGQNHRILNSGYHPRQFFADMWKTIAMGEIWQGEIKNRAKDGSFYWLDTTIIPFCDDFGKPYQYLTLRDDITIRKNIEIELQQIAIQKQALIFITQAILQILDIPNILSISVIKIREILDLDRVAIYRFQPDWSGEFIAESVVDGWVKLVGDDVHKVWEDSYLQATQGGRFRNHESTIVSDIYQADLQPCHIDLLEQFQARAYAIAPIFINGILWGLLGLYKNDQPYAWQSWEIDLLEQTEKQVAIAIQQSHFYEQIQTELSIRKQTELQLLRANDELLRATKLKDEFLANMSHELRTPLNSILGLSEALQDQILGSLNEAQSKAIDTVVSSGEHLLSLINDILDLSKIVSGMMELDIAPVSVKNLCDSSLVFVKQIAFHKSIQVFSNIPPQINKIDVEERRIKHVLINLLTNAVKFTPNEGQVNLLVAVGSGDTWQGKATIPQQLRDMNSPTIVFQVVDTGIGIAAKDLKRLFQPFVQVDSALNRQYEGTGLGLALVKQIVELHGGQVMVESELGKGSRFTVALPHAMSQSHAPESAPIATTPLPIVVNSENATAPLILVAEDNDANIQTFISYLTAIDYRVIVAKNGIEVVSMAKANPPDIILMDIQMPIVDGFEATKQIRRDPNLINTPIIALTALAMEGDRERCLAAGMNEYMSKPIKFKQLVLKITELLQITKP